MPPEKLNPNALAPGTLALMLTNAGPRLVTEQQVRSIADAGNLLSASDSIKLIQFTAVLAQAEGKANE
jgi:hypothetical protein